MGDIKGFLKIKRQNGEYRPVCERVKDYRNVCLPREDGCSQEQASRCMDCGTPFCHWACPIANYIPEWNDLVFGGHWEEAARLLFATNSLPEVTGRVCPALCEFSCVLGINDDAVTIRENELAIAEYAFREGLIKPLPPLARSGKRVAVIGSGPAGLSCADQLNKAGHTVTVFERDSKIGGILRFGIPDFKLEKDILDRRIKIWEEEGIEFRPGVNIGVDKDIKKLSKEFDALCLACGCRKPRDLAVEGRELSGIYFAMDYLTQVNRVASGDKIPADEIINAKGKKVLVIGGGDTGSDCVGTACRQQAACVTQIELLPQPSEYRTEDLPWPKYPLVLKTSSSHQEGVERRWSVLTKKFIGESGRVKKLSCAKANLGKEVPGTDFEIEADMVILALGFFAPERKGPIEGLNLELDNRGNVKCGEDFMTSRAGVFSCGDMRRGQSLVVWAIAEGRSAARAIDEYLKCV
ncbi:MAG: glutamate synthase subunit beta [Candidatus Omnitrophica bacterium]|nr:glutamate synthase subunit beta [Candidatus Omnitrophota bacterium]